MSLPKFRAWDNEQKKMCHKVYVGPEGWHGEYWENGVMVGCFSDDSVPGNVLMQSTGLKDNNGVEIFEGDIVRFRYDEFDDLAVSKIIWGGDYPAFEISPNPFYESNGLMTIVEDWHCEVIGNIHSTPELLTGRKG